MPIALVDHTKIRPPYEDLLPGTTVRIHQKIVEGAKSRVQVYEGLIIKRHQRKTLDATITVRRMSVGNIGVERIFPIFSPLIVKIEILKRHTRVRRARLYYLRARSGKGLKFSEDRILRDVDMTIQAAETAE